MYLSTTDLAGEVCFCPHFFQTKTRINHLINKYLSLRQLCDRLSDLSQQFANPQPYRWFAIKWQDLHPEQVIGIELNIFLSIIQGALDIEAPAGKYTQIALVKIYWHLSQQKITPQHRDIESDRVGENLYQDLSKYRYALNCVVTEYGAVCLYLWLMSHTTGTLQQVLAKILQNKINHLTKFWGIAMSLASDATERLIKYLLSQIHTILPVSYEAKLQPQANLKSTFEPKILMLDWQSWSTLSKGELIYTFMEILRRMWC